MFKFWANVLLTCLNFRCEKSFKMILPWEYILMGNFVKNSVWDRHFRKLGVYPYEIFSCQMWTILGRDLDHISHKIFLLKEKNSHSKGKTYCFAIWMICWSQKIFKISISIFYSTCQIFSEFKILSISQFYRKRFCL